LKVFLDTNVLVSAFITRGLCADIFRIILSEHDLILCNYVLDELEDVLRRKIDLPDKQITSILQYLKTFDIVTNHTPPTNIDLRDKNDIPVISAALNSYSDIIVTGDKDLLEVSKKYGIKIVDPRTFFQLIKGIDNSL
jgi:putative PIN family toxin of toxin-antitoxin system